MNKITLFINKMLIAYLLVSGICYLAFSLWYYGLDDFYYQTFYVAPYIVAYPVSFIMAGTFLYLLDKKVRRFAIPYFLIWFGLINLINLPQNIIINIYYTPFEMICFASGLIILWHYDKLPTFHNIHITSNTLFLILLSAFIMDSFNDAYHIYSMLFMYYILCISE